jgi:ABC-2 type transport system ATP-binding protein
MPIITVNDLEKTYYVSEHGEGFTGSLLGLFKRQTRPVEAVKKVSFSIEPGELVAFLGPNGAGKTTTLKMLSGLLYPTGGEIRVFGHIPFEKDYGFLRRFAFVMGQRHQLWWELPALDTFRLNAAIFDLSPEKYKARLEELDHLLELDPLWQTPVKKLSLGQRMKMELACSLIHEPELLLLDEPTLGLDVVMQKTLRDFIARINQEKKTTVLLTSHNMSDIESLCKRVIVIHNGTLLYDGDLNKLVKEFAPVKTIRAVLKSGELKESTAPHDQVAKHVKEILENSDVLDLTVEEPPLEDVIRRIFSGGKV